MPLCLWRVPVNDNHRPAEKCGKSLDAHGFSYNHVYAALVHNVNVLQIMLKLHTWSCGYGFGSELTSGESSKIVEMALAECGKYIWVPSNVNAFCAVRNKTWSTAPAGASAKARLGSAERRDRVGWKLTWYDINITNHIIHYYTWL